MKLSKILVCGLASGLFVTASASDSLMSVYLAARQYDPTFRSARYELDAGRQAKALARANLLPSISYSFSRSMNIGDREVINGTGRQELDYFYKQQAVSARLPLFNIDAVTRYRQSNAQVGYSEAVFSKKEIDFATRLCSAYFDVLLAGEKLKLAEAELVALQEQSRYASRRKAGGEGTRTEIAEAESRLKVAEANRIDAQAQLTIAKRTLESMTGQAVGSLRYLRPDFVPVAVKPTELSAWEGIALDLNPDVIAQRKTLDNAKLEVQRARSGHLPRLDAVVSYTDSENDSVTTLNQRTKTSTVGLQLNLPLFAGGSTQAATSQAISNRERAAADLDATTSRVLIELQRQLLATQAGISKISAYDRALESTEVALEGTRKGLNAGLRTNLEVLNAQRDLFSVKANLAQARYDFLNSQLRLKAAAGTLSEVDIVELDTFLLAGES